MAVENNITSLQVSHFEERSKLKQSVSLLPKLRFKEFEGEWEHKKLGEISKIERGRFSPRPRNNPIYYNGLIPFVQTSDVVNSKGRIIKYTQTLNEKGLKVSKKFKKGSILITIAANIGYAGVLEIDMACPDSLIGITCKESIYNYFLNYIFEIEQPKMDYLAVAAAQKNINIDFLKPYKICFPKKIEEQQKIAAFLTAIDTKIQQLTSKKQLLENYKKGAMQQLFRQQLRFKPDVIARASSELVIASQSLRGTKQTQAISQNETEFPDWEEKKLGEIAKFLKGKGLPKSELLDNGHYKCIHYGELFTKYKETIKRIISRTNINSNRILSKENDILMPTSDVTPNGLATASCLNKNNIIIGGDVLIIRQEEKKLDGVYFSYLISSNKKGVMRLVSGSTVYHLYGSDMKTLKIKIPYLQEQQKIATYLSAIDKKIENVQTQIEKTEAFKKGLLQQMFV
jgi:type I restriction enzyme S subunit